MKTQTNELRMESRSGSRFTGVRVHFIGIGGCGMNGLANMLVDAGAIVTGSDPHLPDTARQLIARNVNVSRDQMGELLSKETELVVRSAAILDHNLEFKAAKARGIPVIKYAELLGQVMEERHGIAVAGTHGKSTTTAMLAYALMQCGEDPSFVVGGTVKQLGGGGSRSGMSKLFVAEACEFDRSFLKLHPKIAIINNIEEDHLDCYKNIFEINDAFRRFAMLVPKDGLILANSKDVNVAIAMQSIASPIQRVMVNESGARPTDVQWVTDFNGLKNGGPCGTVYFNGQEMAKLQLSIPGIHNLFNATMALAACHAVGADLSKAAAAINEFTGVDRRLTEVGKCKGAMILDDYGHHPTEIKATLRAICEKYQPSRLFCVFQPHQHSRTRFLLRDFATSFAAATETIVPEIYFVRDSDLERERITAYELVEKIIDNGQDAVHINKLKDIPQYLFPKLQTGDVVVTMGAGKIGRAHV